MTKPRKDRLVEEIRFNEKYANLYLSEYKTKIDSYALTSRPIIKKKTLFIDDYIKRLTAGGIEGSIIPPNVRYIEELEGGRLVVVEEPPAYRTIQVDMGFGDEIKRLKNAGKLDMMGYKNWEIENKRPYTFTLAFPYVVFIFYITQTNRLSIGQVYLRTQQMSGLSDYLLKMPMLNISNDGYICFGNEGSRTQRSFTATIQHAVMVWWSAIFNQDYIYNYSAYKNVPVLNSYLEWQYMGQVNPMFIYNADWIKIGQNIGEKLSYIKRQNKLYNKERRSYKDFSKLFYQAQDMGKKERVSTRSKNMCNLFYDIAQGTYLDRYTNVSVGDSFETAKGQMAFIDSFVGFKDGGNIKYIQVEINGRSSLMKITQASCDWLAKKINNQRRATEATLPNGTVVKPGQILIIERGAGKTYHKVDFIRKSRGLEDEEILEVKLGSDYYITSNLEATEFKVDEPEIDGIKLNKDDQYIVIGDVWHSGSRVNAYRMRFDSIDVSSNGDAIARFVNCHPLLDGHDKRVRLSVEAPRRQIYRLDEVKRIQGPMRIGRGLFFKSNVSLEPIPEVSWGINGITGHDSNFSLNRLKGEHTKQLLTGDKFFVEGADFDTEFAIGDKVVVANWENPLDVLTVKMIQGFKYTEDYGHIYFILIDKEGKLSETQYVDGSTGVIYTGRVRKVTNKVGHLSVGTKIRATVAGIPCFPKKDVNIIVAFIIDTNREPLVLCSNGCTLWLGDVQENFKCITLKSKQWHKLDHAPLDLSKIKFQAGDIINGLGEYKTKYGYLLYDPSPTRALRAMPLEYFNDYSGSYPLDRYMAKGCRLDCIPAPRVSTSKIEQVGVLKGMLDLHSYDVFENNLSTRYLNQRRA